MKNKMIRTLKLWIVFAFIIPVLAVSCAPSQNGEESTATTSTINQSDSNKVPDDNTDTDTDTTSTTESSETSENMPGETTLVFAGDIYLSESIIKLYDSKGLDGVISKDLQNEISEADIAMVNEEFPFSTKGDAMKDKQYTFRIHPKYVSLFQNMQLDVVTLANNHVLDYGENALLDTLDTLKNANIKYVGAGKNISEAKETKYFDVNNQTIAILGASRVIPSASWNAGENKAGLLTTYDPSALIEEIKTAREKSNYVIVYVHWGLEKKASPEKYQRDLAKQYIDAGADLVVGSHPHVLQGIEYYQGKPIIYSLGNFMFYNTIGQTAVLKVTLQEDQDAKVQLIPCKAENGQTFTINSSKERAAFYTAMTDISFGVTFDKYGIVIQK